MNDLRATLAAAMALALSACGGAKEPADAVTVFAAASTQGFVSEIARRHEQETGVRVRLSFGASSALARQIENGARADVFVSAHPEWVDRLEERGLVEAGTRRDLLGNRLVLAIPREHFRGIVVNFRMDHHFDFDDAWTGRIAIADPEHVPAGVYAKEALTALGWWEDIQDQIVPTEDARAAARLVAMGEVQAGIVYASDAAGFEGLAAAATFPAESHEPIRYPGVLCSEASPGALAFLNALTTPEAAEVARSFGFIAPPPAPAGSGIP